MKIILKPEDLRELQAIIEKNLRALSQAQFEKESTRKQISEIIVNHFKKYLGIM